MNEAIAIGSLGGLSISLVAVIIWLLVRAFRASDNEKDALKQASEANLRHVTMNELLKDRDDVIKRLQVEIDRDDAADKIATEPTPKIDSANPATGSTAIRESMEKLRAEAKRATDDTPATIPPVRNTPLPRLPPSKLPVSPAQAAPAAPAGPAGGGRAPLHQGAPAGTKPSGK